MKNYLLLLCFLFANISYGQVVKNALINGERTAINSTYLKEERTFQVYLPPNYFFDQKGNFPVVYLMDGDYNFHYDTGLFELLSSVAGKIPEMIIVGISDKGSAKYRANCTPSHLSKKKGNASNFMSFIEKELKPYIQKNYRTSNYDILIGHSIGGLFVTNYFLGKPKAFDSSILLLTLLCGGAIMKL